MHQRRQHRVQPVRNSQRRCRDPEAGMATSGRQVWAGAGRRCSEPPRIVHTSDQHQLRGVSLGSRVTDGAANMHASLLRLLQD